MLGESLQSIGNLMLDDYITEVVTGYESSIFDNKPKLTKLDYLMPLLLKYKDTDKESKLQRLYNLAESAEETKILGRILKINQGLPTNMNEFYSYTTSITKYVESRFNKELVEEKRRINAQKTNGEKVYTTEINKRIANEWQYFDLMKFINNPEYQLEMINKYERNKVNFNILDTIAKIPHFKAMFSTLSTNKEVLTRLSVRDHIQDIVWNRAPRIKNDLLDPTSGFSASEITQLNDLIDQHLRYSWILSKNISINIPPYARNNPVADRLYLNNKESIDDFIKYVEEYIIPTLKEKLPDNKFIQSLTFGLKQNIPYYRIGLNMIQIDNTQKTRMLYEKILSAFNDLDGIKIQGIDMNLVDLFYLYNLVINKDKFGPNSMTRIFEDIVISGKDLLINDYNNWIDNQNAEHLSKEVLNDLKLKSLDEQSTDETQLQNDGVFDSTIGFNNTDSVEDAEVISETTNQSSSTETTQEAYYDTKQSPKASLIELVRQSENPYLHIVTDSDLVNEDASIRNANGFIRNGEVYINVDRANDDTIIHEFGHLYLADAKIKNPAQYYKLLSKVRNSTLYKSFLENPRYANKKGSDLEEEVLATMISNYFKDSSPFGDENGEIVRETLDLVSEEFKQLIQSNVLPDLSSTFVENYKEQQKLATQKNVLFDSKTLEYC